LAGLRRVELGTLGLWDVATRIEQASNSTSFRGPLDVHPSAEPF
jgi:hypothetical protein